MVQRQMENRPIPQSDSLWHSLLLRLRLTERQVSRVSRFGQLGAALGENLLITSLHIQLVLQALLGSVVNPEKIPSEKLCAVLPSFAVARDRNGFWVQYALACETPFIRTWREHDLVR
jgi:hypothetical protein